MAFKKIIFILIIFATLLLGTNFLDPDFGWHLRTGQLIIQSGIPKTDPFSYTMPTFDFVDHAWLSDSIIAKTFPLIGLQGLSFVFALLALISLLVTTQKKYLNPFFLLAVITLASGIAVRPLVVSWVLFAVLLKIVLDDKWWNKLKYWIPGFFLVWANLHGGFSAGLILLLFRRNWLVFLLSLVTTLVNPYGLGLWKEVFSTMFDSSLRFTILEWLPSPLQFSPAWIMLTVISCFAIFRYWKKYTFAEKGIFFCFLLFSLSSLRNQPLFVLVSLPILFKGENFLKNDVGRNLDRYTIAIRIMWVISFVTGMITLFFCFKYINNLQEDNYYPKKAISYLKTNSPSGEVFSIYNWGGYLIWKFPEKKVFIDGRMPSWREPINIFKFSDDIITGKIDYKPVFVQYNINTVLWPNTTQKDSFVKMLEKDGWKEIYKDNIAVVYQKG